MWIPIKIKDSFKILFILDLDKYAVLNKGENLDSYWLKVNL